ncbi:hypothetical protein COU19_01810 [Candidatus Kaiserbacteria bacterium CG10_big_fil_rev_8_21_14_0_10_56_12]|uniref:Uncharacterized protein n=1 Tax=Candidatus Kaiserbacteria bacterium CG10_big_fil_rev_8_21_14_0_10_56_12 TaxID=1974611 RepID=A0A2H0U9X0_9BACT|nr:MAG: hypothetical protein COU19_01810 [Candidatus Kaiserbacteria bacterium CG10_big_fil_rev_8_21_14_0_10_56_12]
MHNFWIFFDRYPLMVPLAVTGVILVLGVATGAVRWRPSACKPPRLRSVPTRAARRRSATRRA